MARRISLIVVALIRPGWDDGERAGAIWRPDRHRDRCHQAGLPGATVTATNRETGAQRVVVSGADGTYRVPDLDPGRYSIAFELSAGKYQNVGEAPRAAIFRLLAQTAPGAATVAIRTSRHPNEIAPVLRRTIQQVNPARVDWPLRNDCLPRRAADAGDRCADGARCARGRHHP